MNVKFITESISLLLKVISDAHTCPAKIRATVVLIARNIIQKHFYIIEQNDVVNSGHSVLICCNIYWFTVAQIYKK